MTERIRKYIRKLKKALYGFFLKENPRSNMVLKPLSKSVVTLEERRGKALTYLVENYFETKKREEEYLRKLESYGRFRRWCYEKGNSLKYIGMVVKELIVKPSIITMMLCSTYLSIWLGITIGPRITRFTEMHIAYPFSYVFDVLILFPIGFFPGILSIILKYHIDKKKLRRILENYGVRI